MRRDLVNTIKQGIVLAYPSLTEAEIYISEWESKKGYSVSVYTMENRKRIVFHTFLVSHKGFLEEEIYNWLKKEMYTAHNSFKKDFNAAIRKMLSIEKFVEEIYEITLSPG